MSGNHRALEDEDTPAAPAAPGGPFALAWRSYIKAVFAKGFMYQVSCNASSFLYIAENKTLPAGQEHRSHEGEAMGRKMAVVFFERLPEPGNLVQRARRDTQGMHQSLLTIAELLLALGGIVLPADPGRTAAETEILLEAKYAELDILRFTCAIEPEDPDVHVYQLEDQVDAEVAMVSAAPC